MAGILKFYLIFILFSFYGVNAFNGEKEKRATVTSCPDGYVKHQQSCYTFHHELLSWPESITFCKALGSHLVKIETISEFNYLKLRAHDLQGAYPGNGYWIGATDAIEEGNWQWIDPLVPMTRDQVTWIPGEPSNVSREDCAVLWMPSNYLVGDYYCSSKLHLICELEISPEPQQILG